ncbi:MAG: Maf family protein [Anaerolineae bacterium]
MLELILASQSPRRRELIQLLGYPVRFMSADVDESSITHPDPAMNVTATARLKAAAIAGQIASRFRDTGSESRHIIIAADTTVALDGDMLGKPKDAANARRMLKALRGRTHQVHTGIVLLDVTSGEESAGVATATVTMRNYSDTEMDAYIASGDPLDKAGAYAIQHPVFRPVAQLDGCFTTVMGLPLCRLIQMMEAMQLPIQADYAAVGQAHQQYHCRTFDLLHQ